MKDTFFRFNWAFAAVLVLAWLACPGTRPLRAADIHDAGNYLWDIQGDGSIDDGSSDTFDGGLYLMVNGRVFEGGPMQAGRSPREVVIGPQQMGDFRVTRKIHVPEKMACCCFLEIIENVTNRAVQVQVGTYSDLGTGAEQVVLPDAIEGRVPYTAIGQGGGGSKSLAYIMASPKGKNGVTPQIDDSEVKLIYKPVSLKPKQRVAFLHICAQRNSVLEADDFAKKFKWRQILKHYTPTEKRLLKNVLAGGGLLSLGGIDLFRGEQGDAIVLTTGEQLSGEIQTPTLTIETEFGPREIPTAQVFSLFDLGRDVRLVLQNGEVLSGRLKGDGLKLKLRGGRDLAIPLDYVVKYGKRLPKPKIRVAGEEEKPVEAEQFTFTDPIFLLRNGDRLVGKLTAKELKVRSLHGLISIKAERIKNVRFPNVELRTPVFELKDGTSFCGLPETPHLELSWAGQTVSLDWGQLAGILFTPEEAVEETEEEHDGPDLPSAHGQLRLLNRDVFCGKITSTDGKLTVETPFGPQSFGVDQVLRLRPRPTGRHNMRVTLWDGTVFPARFSGKTLQFLTQGGSKLAVPLGLVRMYWRPLALPPPAEMKRIEGFVGLLGSNDPQTRDKAQSDLLQCGFGIRAILAKHWDHEDLETRTRVRNIYKKLQESAPPELLEDDTEDEPVPITPAASSPQNPFLRIEEIDW